MKAFATFAILLTLALPAAATNIIFIMADDLGYMDVGFNNPKTFYDTPALNGLAKESVRFTAGYAACPVCSPTRSSILTGQYPARTRNTDYFGAANGFKDQLPDDPTDITQGDYRHHKKRPVLPAPYLSKLAASHTTLAEAFKAKGYATMHAGKWHLGDQGSWPKDHGFDINIGGGSHGGPYSGDKYFSPYANPTLPDGPKGEHLPDRLATEVSKFIATNKDHPFFVYLPFYSVHTPLMGRPDLIKKYEAKRKALGLKPKFEPEFPRENRTVQEHAIYAAMVEAMDAAVGKVLKALDDNGVADDTIVIFFSDNGGLSTSEGSPTSNLPYRAGKGWAYEGGIREPLIVRWPGKGKAGAICDVPVISTDFYPTLLEVCGFDPMPEQHIDGTSFANLLKNPSAKHDRAPLFWHYPHWGNQGGIPNSTIRDGDWKLIRYYYKKAPELFHLANDPGEQSDLAKKESKKLSELNTKLDALLKETDALMPVVNPMAKKGFKKW
ncbi:MAG: sulfatase [Verrucomicrobiae bacterium]|nr:sulfatase [Verrucomicrobiae bacterium]NNJ42728.1 sulfatase [Akkermansiaceae bacterium]